MADIGAVQVVEHRAHEELIDSAKDRPIRQRVNASILHVNAPAEEPHESHETEKIENSGAHPILVNSPLDCGVEEGEQQIELRLDDDRPSVGGNVDVGEGEEASDDICAIESLLRNSKNTPKKKQRKHAEKSVLVELA